jgi:ferredoxin-NADP reductase
MNRTLTVRVARISEATPEVRVFEFEHPWGGRLPGYSAGAHLDVHTPGGFVRPYSLARAPLGAAADGTVERYVIGVKREAAGRGGSAALHTQLHEGDLVAVGAPRNAFPLQPAPRHLLLAGGIGLTPLLAMAEELQHAGGPFTLAVFARSRRLLPFARELAALGPALRLHLDDPAAAEKLDLAALLAAPEPGARLYLCGPAGFMQAAQQAATAAGWPDEQVHREFFAAPDGSALAAGEPFTLRLARRGGVVAVAAGQRAVDALAEAGVDVPTSCEEGLCGSCVVGWRPEGAAPEHRDLCLTGAERRTKVALCCSRAPRGGTLVLDL